MMSGGGLSFLAASMRLSPGRTSVLPVLQTVSGLARDTFLVVLFLPLVY
jgi:hypothetical protein